jgi:hypothetical protein
MATLYYSWEHNIQNGLFFFKFPWYLNISHRLYYRVIRLRCHKKKRKRCRKNSNLLPVNGTYSCRRNTTFEPQHINTKHGRHGGRGTVYTARTSYATLRAAFPEWSGPRPRWSSVGGHRHSVVFVRRQVTWRTPTRKSLETWSPGNSRAMGWADQGRTSDCCMCRLKTPALREPNVAERYCVGKWWCPVRSFSRNMYHFTMSRMKRDMVTIVLVSKSPMGPCNTRKFRIPYDALCSLLLCYRHVCFSYASSATRLNRL